MITLKGKQCIFITNPIFPTVTLSNIMHFRNPTLYFIVMLLSFTLQGDSAPVDNECLETTGRLFHAFVGICERLPPKMVDKCNLTAIFLVGIFAPRCTTNVYTLCRVDKAAWYDISKSSCTSWAEETYLTHEKCKEMGSNTVTFHSASGKDDKDFAPSTSICVPVNNFDCFSRC